MPKTIKKTVEDDNLMTCLTYLIDDEPAYVIKTTVFRDVYYLYKVKNGKLTKTRYEASTPTDLYKYIKDYT